MRYIYTADQEETQKLFYSQVAELTQCSPTNINSFGDVLKNCGVDII